MERAVEQEGDMSNLGMRIEVSGFEVGFKAETREEFDSYMARLTLVAAE